MNGPVLVRGTGALIPIPGAIFILLSEAFEFVFPWNISMKALTVVYMSSMLCGFCDVEL